MKVLVFNCGSSTLKFQLVEVSPLGAAGPKTRSLARGLVDRIGENATSSFARGGGKPRREPVAIENHEQAVEEVLGWLAQGRDGAPWEFDAVGHRVVHGGDRFRTSVLIDDEVLEALEALSDLAPLHNPACVSAIRAARRALGASMPMVAAFDTSFHHTVPDSAATYAIPYELTVRHKIRRYGFHGLAHHYLALRYAELAHRPEDQVDLITLHLGNGCSAAAIRGGRSVETSMGFTPLEGLVMGTRSGDLDPAIVGFLSKKERLSVAEVEALLNERSGLLGISGRSKDMRELLQRAPSDARSGLAVEIFCHRARKYLGAYLAVLGGADALIFSGGIGENSPEVRAQICAGMDWCGLQLDPELNQSRIGTEGLISPATAELPAYVIPVDEERVIALETLRLVVKSK
ncbi:MAG: acetate kinase [Deltaproteobacteria bacterium]|nr:acetate kinase [Deltaproteobacteria bacterium]